MTIKFGLAEGNLLGAVGGAGIIAIALAVIAPALLLDSIQKTLVEIHKKEWQRWKFEREEAAEQTE